MEFLGPLPKKPKLYNKENQDPQGTPLENQNVRVDEHHGMS